MDKNQESGKERRRYVRIRQSLVVQYGYAVDNDKIKWDMTAVKDISEIGMHISAAKVFLPNEIIYLRIQFPNKPFQRLKLKGRVIESTAGGFMTRIEFMDLDDSNKAAIHNYINWFLNTGKDGGKDELWRP